MKKKTVLWIALALLVPLMIGGAVWSKQYYEDYYVGSDYYARIPPDFDITPVTMYSMQGEEVGLGKKYKLTAYNEQGEAKEVEFNVHGDDSAKYPQPGEWLKISASKQLVVGWSVTQENKVPAKALEQLKG